MSMQPSCHNKPRTFDGKYTAQSGWATYEDRGMPVRVPVFIEVQSRFEPGCKYDRAATDAGCAGCCNRPVDQYASLRIHRMPSEVAKNRGARIRLAILADIRKKNHED